MWTGNETIVGSVSVEGQCGLGMRLVGSECGGAMWTGNETSLE